MTHVDTVSSNYRLGFKDIKIKKTQTKTSLLKCFALFDHLSKGVENVSTQEPVHRYSEQFYSWLPKVEGNQDVLQKVNV